MDHSRIGGALLYLSRLRLRLWDLPQSPFCNWAMACRSCGNPAQLGLVVVIAENNGWGCEHHVDGHDCADKDRSRRVSHFGFSPVFLLRMHLNIPVLNDSIRDHKIGICKYSTPARHGFELVSQGTASKPISKQIQTENCRCKATSGAWFSTNHLNNICFTASIDINQHSKFQKQSSSHV